MIPGENNPVMKRLWNPDTSARENGALDTTTKEMPGLVVPLTAGCHVVMMGSTIALVNVSNKRYDRPGIPDLCSR